MRSNVVINKNKINNNDYFIKINPEDIFKQVLEIDDNIKIIKNGNSFLVFKDNEVLCNFKIDYSEELYDYIINVFYKNCSYNYYCDESKERLELNLRDYYFNEEGKNFYITNHSYGVSAIIEKNNELIAIEIEEKEIDNKMFEALVKTLKFDDNLVTIYNKLTMLSTNKDIKIKKSVKLNTCDYSEKITDLLVIRDYELQDYVTTINSNVNGKKVNYVIKKDVNSYSITLINDSIEVLSASYFAVNEQVNFIKKLESKGKIHKILKKK